MAGGQRLVVITGGAGFLGHRIADRILEQGAWRVRVFDIRQTWQHPDVEFVTGDLGNVSELERGFAGADAVIHCAAVADTSRFTPEVMKKVNVGGTENVIKACHSVGVPALVATSSASIGWNGGDVEDGREDAPYFDQYLDAYSQTKMESEKLLLAANGTQGSAGVPLATLTLRPHSVFGPGDMQAVPTMVAHARAGKSKWILGDGENIVDWTYIDNVVHAHVLALDRLSIDSPAAGQAFYITNGEPVRFWDFCTSIFVGLGYPKPRIRVPFKLVLVIAQVVDVIRRLLALVGVTINPTLTPQRIALSATHHWFNIDKARTLLGYQPIVSYEEGVKRTLEHFAHLANPAVQKR